MHQTSRALGRFTMARLDVITLLCALFLACLALVAAQPWNPCDIHHWDELSGAPQDDPDRPCHVHYERATFIKKKRLVLQRQQQQQQLQLLLQQQAAGSTPATPPDATAVPPQDTSAGSTPPVTSQAVQAIDTNKLLALHAASATDPGADMLVSTTIQPIFWGTKWGLPSFVGQKITGLAQLFTAHNGSRYADTCSEYTGTNGHPTYTTYIGHIMDATSTSGVNPGRTSVIGKKVCSTITNPVANGYYPVFVDFKRGARGYCAWHSYGWCNGGTYNTNGAGTRIAFGFHFNLDNDPGCDPGDSSTGHSQGLAALANVAMHELEEARTDPYCCGYWDANGAENADKCGWLFGPLVILSDGSQWKVQAEWSNAAYQEGTGFGADAGCLSGA